MGAFRSDQNHNLKGHAKKASPPKGSAPGKYVGKDSKRCGATPNRPKKSGNCYE